MRLAYLYLMISVQLLEHDSASWLYGKQYILEVNGTLLLSIIVELFCLNTDIVIHEGLYSTCHIERFELYCYYTILKVIDLSIHFDYELKYDLHS